MSVVSDQVDAMIEQRVARGLSPSQAAQTLMMEIGPEHPDDNDDRRAARAYLTELVEGD